MGTDNGYYRSFLRSPCLSAAIIQALIGAGVTGKVAPRRNPDRVKWRKFARMAALRRFSANGWLSALRPEWL